MPIKPENRALYPADWPTIALEAKQRAAWACQHQGCAAKQYDYGYWHGEPLRWVRIGGPCKTFGEARQLAAEEHWSRFGDEDGAYKILVIVLTVAHLDHDPTNCDPANLAAMCQRHHLAYDHQHHLANAQATRRAKAGTLELFP